MAGGRLLGGAAEGLDDLLGFPQDRAGIPGWGPAQVVGPAVVVERDVADEGAVAVLQHELAGVVPGARQVARLEAELGDHAVGAGAHLQRLYRAGPHDLADVGQLVGDAADEDRHLVFADELLVEPAGAADPPEHVQFLQARGHQREVGAGVGDLLEDLVEGLTGLGDRRGRVRGRRQDQALADLGWLVTLALGLGRDRLDRHAGGCAGGCARRDGRRLRGARAYGARAYGARAYGARARGGCGLGRDGVGVVGGEQGPRGGRGEHLGQQVRERGGVVGAAAEPGLVATPHQALGPRQLAA